MKGSGWSAPELMVKPGAAGSLRAGGSKNGVRKPSAASPAAAPNAPVERYSSGDTSDSPADRAPALSAPTPKTAPSPSVTATPVATHTVVRALRLRGVPACSVTAVMGKSWGCRSPHLGMTARKVGRTTGFRESPLTLYWEKRNLSSVRRQQPAEPQASTERWERGKPKGKPQGGTEGSRENAARRDRGMGASPARGT